MKIFAAMICIKDIGSFRSPRTNPLMPVHKEVLSMPHKPKHPCAYPGCPALIREGRYCDQHKSIANREYNQHQRNPDSNKVYGRRWHTIRDLYISKHPLCERCLQTGRLVSAEEVHHIIPIDQGGTHDDENLMSLCKPCHSGITISETNRDS